MNILIDRNFRTVKTCKYHCFPSCHPEQIDENDVKYGCTHHVWTCNRNGGFVPIVKCGGNPKNCPLKDPKYKDMIVDYLSEMNGKTFLSTSEMLKYRTEMEDLNEILGI